MSLSTTTALTLKMSVLWWAFMRIVVVRCKSFRGATVSITCPKRSERKWGNHWVSAWLCWFKVSTSWAFSECRVRQSERLYLWTEELSYWCYGCWEMLSDLFKEQLFHPWCCTRVPSAVHIVLTLMQANLTESNKDGCVTHLVRDKTRHSLVFIRTEVIVLGLSSGRQATLSFLGRRGL